MNIDQQKLNKEFKPVVALNKERFNIWKILDAHKDEPDLMITFKSLNNDDVYSVIRLDKLLTLLYNNKEEKNE